MTLLVATVELCRVALPVLAPVHAPILGLLEHGEFQAAREDGQEQTNSHDASEPSDPNQQHVHAGSIGSNSEGL